MPAPALIPSALHGLARRSLPFGIRRAFVELRSLPRWLAERRSMAPRRVEAGDLHRFTFVLSAHASPLERTPGAVPRELQRGKERNVRLGALTLDGIMLEPGRILSFHHAIGRPNRRRGFRSGLELRDGRASSGVGGGLCQISNGLHWTALQAGMRIVERHRQGLDLFPDDRRTVPFGCGATVVYPSADLRVQNPLSEPILLRTRVENGVFRCEIRSAADPGIRVEVHEEDQRFFREGNAWMRENRLRRRITRPDGSVLVDEEVAHNRGRVMYEPTPEQLACGGASRKPLS